MFDGFMKIDGIEGESSDSKHKNWIQLESFTHGARQDLSSQVASAGGGFSGKVQLEDLHITKFVDKASPLLFKALASGQHFSTVLIELWRAAGQQKLKYMDIKLSNAVVSSYQVSGGNGGDLPMESVSLHYGKIEQVYVPQKRADGSGVGQTKGGYDLEADKPI